ncbi:acyl-CoA dehydrogenase family protein [Streptomyces sp. TRM 70361]|uniref:acyl-CoA dehydrogenase family protein n=1 Tax=Streptomyces sp. TRM 70361 TaxID=3116553 RepID=UPI002E7B7D9E|nr:acyl-CoA dehydrogenase family protein [Streptomyces sp. TRM 70361]MEE1939101.1 acyl-CoA dehydrogenase family protein [Streptomyces sp. TRM 70361]
MTQNEPFVELDLSISEKAKEWQSRARAFASECAVPIGHQLDLMSPEEAVAPGSPYFEFMARARDGGFMSLTAPPEYGGPGLTRLEEYLVLEELATGDAGLATSLFIAPLVFQYAHNSGSPRLVEELSRPYFSGERPEWSSCFAITEPNHGSDMMAAHTPSLTVAGGDVTARKDGDGWVMDGRKAAWVSCTLTASHALVCCTLDSTGLARGGIAIVPLDHDGVTRGAPLDKLGLRSMNQAQLTFNAVRIPEDYMLVGEDAYATAMHATHAMASVSMALLAFGTGRAAYEGAVRYTRERVQGGRPLRDHQATQLRVFRMFTKLEAARAMTRAVYTYNYGMADEGGIGSLAHSCASKVFATDTAFEVCDIAVQLCGARATQREGVRLADGYVFYPEKLLRDAKSFKVADGENDLLALIGAAHLD